MLANRSVRMTARLLVALLLVPALIVTMGNATPARAATAYGPSDTYKLSWDAGGLTCNGSARWATTDGVPKVESVGRCDGHGFYDLNDGDSYVTQTFKGMGSSGSSCNIGGTGTLDEDAVFRVEAGGSGGMLVYDGCVITQVCMEVAVRDAWDSDWNMSERCTTVTLGAPLQSATPVPSCTYADEIKEPVIGQHLFPVNTITKASGRSVTFLFNVKIDSQWSMYVIGGYPPTAAAESALIPARTWLGEGEPRYQKIGNGVQSATASTSQGPIVNAVTSSSTSNTTTAPIEDITIQGYGLYRSGPSISTSPRIPLSPGDMTGRYGVTDPSQCSYYWGSKLWNDPNSTRDEPALFTHGGYQEPPTGGPLEPPGPSEEDACNFSLTDPSSWLEGGMCAAVGLLGVIGRLLAQAVGVLGGILGGVTDLLGAIGGLVGELLEGLVQLLTDLFVPDEGFFDEDLADLQEQWGDTAPGVYADALADAIPPLPASSCQGVPVNIDMPMDSGHVNFRFGAACAGDALHTPANIARAAITAALLLGTAVACFRIVTSAIWPGVQVVGNKAGAA